jgi:hypothetical protein
MREQQNWIVEFLPAVTNGNLSALLASPPSEAGRGNKEEDEPNKFFEGGGGIASMVPPDYGVHGNQLDVLRL